jgi:hypothetical protein
VTAPAPLPHDLCLSRRAGEICTRERGHRGLHHRRGTGLLWTELDADPPTCPGGGLAATAAPALADGFPDGRALCPVCTRFVAVRRDGTLPRHRSWRGAASRDEEARRREWFNAFGW